MSLSGRNRDEPGVGAASEQDEGLLLVNAYATVRDLPAFDFPHRLLNSRDLSDPKMIPHLGAFAGYVLNRGNGKMTAMRYHLWRHIQRCHNHAGFHIASRDLPAMVPWALRANAVLFLPDGSVRTPDMTMLMSAAGVFNAEAGLPYPPDAIERRSRTLKRLGDITPKPPASMPPALGNAEVVLRPAPEVLQRVLGLFCVATQGIAVGTGGHSVLSMMREQNPIGMSSLTPQEQAFLEAEVPDARAAAQMSWRCEAMNVLLWALSIGAGHIDPADKIVDVDSLSQRVKEITEDSGAAERSRLRPMTEILDLLDLTWRQHWIVRQADQNKIAIESLNPGVVMERHFALNWLTGFQNDPGTDWDNTDTPT